MWKNNNHAQWFRKTNATEIHVIWKNGRTVAVIFFWNLGFQGQHTNGLICNSKRKTCNQTIRKCSAQKTKMSLLSKMFCTTAAWSFCAFSMADWQKTPVHQVRFLWRVDHFVSVLVVKNKNENQIPWAMAWFLVTKFSGPNPTETSVVVRPVTTFKTAK